MSKSTCSISGCERPVKGYGWCKPHYRRWRRHGDPMGGCGSVPPRRTADELEWQAPNVADIDQGFGHWFAGFVDGEGCFTIKPAARSFTTRFAIGLRIDDLPILEEIMETTGLGDIHLSGRRQGVQGQARWTVMRKDEMQPLIDVFEAFPLRAKKATDFEIWRDAARFWMNVTGNHRHDWTPMRRLKEQLTENRAFDSDEWVERFDNGTVRSDRVSVCPPRSA